MTFSTAEETAAIQLALDRMAEEVKQKHFASGVPIVFLRADKIVWLWEDGTEMVEDPKSLARSGIPPKLRL